jgi:hypothetical protein
VGRGNGEGAHAKLTGANPASIGSIVRAICRINGRIVSQKNQ